MTQFDLKIVHAWNNCQCTHQALFSYNYKCTIYWNRLEILKLYIEKILHQFINESLYISEYDCNFRDWNIKDRFGVKS